jgi:hypothetical protein
MKKGFITTIILFLLVGKAFAASTASQTIQIIIEPVAVISLGDGGSNQTWLTVDEKGVATGSDVVKWTTNMERLTVYIQSNLAPEQQNNLLQARAIQMDKLKTKGTLEGWVTVNNQPSALVTNITREYGGCAIEYQASPKNAEPKADEHIIMLTISEE